MTQKAIITDLNRCVGCLSCCVACKAANNVPVGDFWLKVLRIGPNMPEGAQSFHDAQMYFLPYQCQHCENPECVSVCPTNASHKLDDGTVLVDKSKCIGCQFCVMACPYGVRYLNEEERVVEKCTLCEQKTAQGELPQCVAQCCARARFYGDLDEGYESFEGASDTKLTDYVETFTEDDVHHLKDVGNKPSFAYILRTYEGRRNKVWQGGE